MKKRLEELSEKEFRKFFILGKATWWQLAYRTKWLIRKSKELWIKVTFDKKWNRYIVWIHQTLLTWRRLENPYIIENSFKEAINHLVDKQLYKTTDSKAENIKRLRNKKYYIYYRFCTDLKLFIFNLIKDYYDN